MDELNGRIRELEKKAKKSFDKRHNQLDLFVGDIIDAAPKSDRHSMEHPMFSLATRPDTEIREYEHGDTKITITPSVLGMATIWDKDILLYCASQITEALNRGHKVSRTVKINSYSVLTAARRGTGGNNYNKLIEALDRLSGTRIKTTIKTAGLRETESFGFIDSWKITERHPKSARPLATEIVLSEWLFRALIEREILTFNADYFDLRGGLERGIYMLARKHVGNQAKGWKIKLENLHRKLGVTSTVRAFRSKLKKKIIPSDNLPDYQMILDEESDCVCFSLKERNAKTG